MESILKETHLKNNIYKTELLYQSRYLTDTRRIFMLDKRVKYFILFYPLALRNMYWCGRKNASPNYHDTTVRAFFTTKYSKYTTTLLIIMTLNWTYESMQRIEGRY